MKKLLALLVLFAAASLQAQVTHTINAQDFEFNPANLTINLGDHVNIHFDDSSPDHTFTQVSEATWLANGNAVLPGGYEFGVDTPSPGTDFTITPASTGTIWYVCALHIDMGMKGVIVVTGGSGIEEASAQEFFTLAPNPASSTVQVLATSTAPVLIDLFDATGRNCLSAALSGARTLDVSALPTGAYVADIRDLGGSLLSRQRLSVSR